MERRTWLTRLLSLLVLKNSMNTKGRWVLDTQPIGFSTSGSLLGMCPKSNHLACRHWIFSVNELLLMAVRYVILPKMNSCCVTKSLEPLLYDKERICQ